MKEKNARVEDAMDATKAAVEEGVVPGGGVALLRASKVLQELKLEGDEQIGVNKRWIATNAGHEGSIVVQRVKAMKDDEGFNAQTEHYENLVQGVDVSPRGRPAIPPPWRSKPCPFPQWARSSPSGQGRTAMGRSILSSAPL